MVHHIKLYKKIQQIDIKEARHYLTKLLKLDMFDMYHSRTIKVVEYYEWRMLGMVAAYQVLGIITMKARQRYINIIVDNSFKRQEELANEI